MNLDLVQVGRIGMQMWEGIQAEGQKEGKEGTAVGKEANVQWLLVVSGPVKVNADRHIGGRR